MKPNIVILDGHVTNPGDLTWQPLEAQGSLTIYERTNDATLYERAKEANILVVNKRVLDRNILQRLPKLECICTLATGYNNVDVVAAKELGIVVCNAVGYSSPSVAQQVFAFILAFTNHVALHNESVHKEEWSNAEDFSYRKTPLLELSGQTIGILGLGKIGLAVAQIALAFDMKVIATRRSQQKPAMAGIELVTEEKLFLESDILTLHAPLTESTKEIINATSLRKMKSTAILINTGRGGLVNERDLKEALLNGEIAGAGLDVLSAEPPPPDHVLFNIPNCIITPHIAWATKAARKRLIDIVGQNIASFLEGKPQNIVNG